MVTEQQLLEHVIGLVAEAYDLCIGKSAAEITDYAYSKAVANAEEGCKVCKYYLSLPVACQVSTMCAAYHAETLGPGNNPV